MSMTDDAHVLREVAGDEVVGRLLSKEIDLIFFGRPGVYITAYLWLFENPTSLANFDEDDDDDGLRSHKFASWTSLHVRVLAFLAEARNLGVTFTGKTLLEQIKHPVNHKNLTDLFASLRRFSHEGGLDSRLKVKLTKDREGEYTLSANVEWVG